MQVAHEAKVRFGPAGWSYEDWKGIVYPAGLPRATHPVAWLSQWFDTIEVNATFYRQPDPRHALAWLRHLEDRPDFRFTLKLWEGFTHGREAWPGAAAVQAYRAGIAPLVDAGRLGAVLVQFPWSFRRTPENRQWLARIADAFDGLPLAVELRHATWDTPAVYTALRERGIAFCNIDQPIFKDSIAPSEHVTAPVGYVRLHGRNAADWFREGAGRNDRYNYLYSAEELTPWVDRIKAMKKLVNEIYVVTNNHFAGQAVVNALEMQHAIAPRRYTLPPELLARYPRLRRIQAGDKTD